MVEEKSNMGGHQRSTPCIVKKRFTMNNLITINLENTLKHHTINTTALNINLTLSNPFLLCEWPFSNFTLIVEK